MVFNRLMGFYKDFLVNFFVEGGERELGVELSAPN